MGRGFYDYGETMDVQTKHEIKMYEDEAIKRKILLPKLFIASVLISGCALSVRPLIDYVFTGEIKEYRGDGINRSVTVECWYPFDPNVTWQNILTFILHYTVIWTTPGVILGTDIVFLCISEDFCLQLHTVGISLRRASQRAVEIFKKTVNKREINGIKFDDGTLSGEEYFKKCLDYCISQTVEHHSMIIE